MEAELLELNRLGTARRCMGAATGWRARRRAVEGEKKREAMTDLSMSMRGLVR